MKTVPENYIVNIKMHKITLIEKIMNLKRKNEWQYISHH